MTELKKEIEESRKDAAPLTISIHKLDLGSTEDIENLFKEIETAHSQTGPDILISNAGYGKRILDILDMSLADYEYTIRVNQTASFLLTKLSVPHMRAQNWGRVIYISSIAAYGGGINGCHYASSKGGLISMGRNLSKRLAKDGITVNDVAPAMIGDTGMIPNAKFLEGTPGDVKNIPVGRLGSPAEVAVGVGMFARNGYTTGQSLIMAGGLM